MIEEFKQNLVQEQGILDYSLTRNEILPPVKPAIRTTLVRALVPHSIENDSLLTESDVGCQVPNLRSERAGSLGNSRTSLWLLWHRMLNCKYRTRPIHKQTLTMWRPAPARNSKYSRAQTHNIHNTNTDGNTGAVVVLLPEYFRGDLHKIFTQRR
jgi:hypothetical protein